MSSPLDAASRSRLHHLALGSPEPAALAAFYRDVLGLAELARHLDEAGRVRSVWLDLGGATLMIERTAEAPRRIEGVGAGPFLIAFRVSVPERRRLEQALAAAGLPLEGRTAFTAYGRDPEGNRIALSHHPEPDVSC